MNNQQQELKAIVCRALETFNNQETYLIKNDLSERCICSKFAMHLTNALQDSEYSESYSFEMFSAMISLR